MKEFKGSFYTQHSGNKCRKNKFLCYTYELAVC